jgi:hypothetical protein
MSAGSGHGLPASPASGPYRGEDEQDVGALIFLWLANKFTVDVHLVSTPGFFTAAAKRGAFRELDSGYW